MTARLIAGASRDVTWHESRDAGDMFKSEVGVWRDPDGQFRAYVKDGAAACAPSLTLTSRPPAPTSPGFESVSTGWRRNRCPPSLTPKPPVPLKGPTDDGHLVLRLLPRDPAGTLRPVLPH